MYHCSNYRRESPSQQPFYDATPFLNRHIKQKLRVKKPPPDIRLFFHPLLQRCRKIEEKPSQ